MSKRRFVHWLDPRLPQPPRLVLPPLTFRHPRTGIELTYSQLKRNATHIMDEVDRLSPQKRALRHIFGRKALAYNYDLFKLDKTRPYNFLRDATPEMREMAAGGPAAEEL